jgi:hypothetical protein
MTVATEVASITHTGNGVLTQFSIPFKFLSNDDIQVSLITISTGAAQILNAAQYTLNGAGDEDGGTVTYSPALSALYKLKVERVMAFTQDLGLEREGGFFPEVVEAQLDRIVMMVQQVRAELAAAVAADISSITRNVAGPSSSVVGNIPVFGNGTGTSMTDSGFDPGDFALAAHTHGDSWTEKVKAADWTRSSSTALTSDADLTFSMAANTTYLIEAKLFINSPIAIGFKVGITGPASPTLVQCVGRDTDAAGNVANIGISSYTTVRSDTPGATENVVVELTMRIANGANAGAFAIQFAQNVSSATAATLRKGSIIRHRTV